ncbi:MAG: integrase core domain-containing protein [Alphaproteobacteria bacterium]|nr:integrase core domain-containing protein [Alphaproteobacteria bacterium]
MSGQLAQSIKSWTSKRKLALEYALIARVQTLGRFESLAHATRTVGDWNQFYNHKRPHQALAMKTPAEAFDLAA